MEKHKHFYLHHWLISMLLMFSMGAILLFLSSRVEAAVVITTTPSAVVRTPVVTPYRGYGYYHGYTTGAKVYRGNNYYRGNYYRRGGYHGTTVYRNGNVYHRSYR